ncbi:hypothetical protein [Methylobacterium nigriterrae]|uniref:hypothetical protein n=1 Tax=Methylobacterium nigriterrae TaxID=3127512 RepID=UPI003013A0A1
MKRLAILSGAALIGLGALASSAAEARGGGAVAAGLIGGLAAGALIGAAMSEAHAAPAYGYALAYGYAPVRTYRPVRAYEDDAPVYETRRVVRRYEAVPTGYGYGNGPAGYGWPPADRW